ncbi:hypothetical protein [uncultured Thiodictyon sp.]|uniref:hypothetical protein n=1 Tax=uncultured Thiodictyon sp. TaxID=1846217 RepID=UPI0025F6AB30|nr:hypothetical protein [uncultured Thiodictyon sp.]
MRLIETYRAYRALTPEQRRLLKEKQVAGEYTPAQWLGLLAGLAAYDRQADAVRTWATTAMIVTPMLVFFGALFGSIALGYESLAIPVALGLALLTAAPLVAIFLATRATDLADRLGAVAIPLVSLIGEDLRPHAKVQLALDLRGGATKPKLTATPPARNEDGRSIRERVFRDPWMNGAAVLRDGARLRWRIDDEVHELRVSHSNARGKTKTKTKFRVDTRVLAALDLPAAGYRLRPNPADPTTRAPALEKWIKLRARVRTRQKGTQPRSASLSAVLKTIAGLYARAEPIRTKEPSHV